MAESDIFIIPQDQAVTDKVVVVSEQQRNSGFQFDAVTKYRTRRVYRPTRHSVPSGASITDHVTREPVVFSLKGVITPYNVVSPIRTLAVFQSEPALINLFDGLVEAATSAVETARENRDQLVQFADSFTLLTVLGNEFQHANMIITMVDDPKTTKLGDAYELTVSFRQIKIPRQAARIAPLVSDDALRLGGGAFSEVVF